MSYEPPRWVVYGRRPSGFTSAGKVVTRGVHRENILSEGEAMAFAMKALLEWPSTQLVVVRLDHGNDVNGQRKVIARWNNGKSWWGD